MNEVESVMHDAKKTYVKVALLKIALMLDIDEAITALREVSDDLKAELEVMGIK